MKSYIFFVFPLSILLSFFAGSKPSKTAGASQVYGGADVTMCASPAGTVKAGADGKYIPALKGWGDHNYTISTKSDSAQFYFNQGLGFYYGYHFTEALASFRESSKFDPSCAMGYWGQALAMGPFYNTYVYKMSKEVPVAVAEMLRNSSKVSAKEKDLIDALKQRYSTDMTNSDRKVLDRNYASRLAMLKQKHAGDIDIKALYIDAVMLEHKWDFWTHDGSPRPWTGELVSICENVLRKEQHPAILHYYIHLTEASRRPDRALSAADILKDKLSGIGHMVHMSTHMYQRNGLYTKGVKVNEEANASNNLVDSSAPTLKLGKDRSAHFFAVQSFCAMTAGMYKEGMPIYQRARDRQIALSQGLSTETYSQFVYMMPVLAWTRLGRWDEILSAPQPDSTWKYATVLDQFARGLAQVRTKNIAAAKQSLRSIGVVMQDSLLSVRYMPFNSPLQSCRIAAWILEAEILFGDGNFEGSIVAFQKAIDEEDKMVYREPQDWVIPARQFLGASLLKRNMPREAEKLYREDLAINPGNGWSLLGMYQSLTAQQRRKEADAYKARYKKAFDSADVNITASVF